MSDSSFLDDLLTSLSQKPRALTVVLSCGPAEHAALVVLLDSIGVDGVLFSGAAGDVGALSASNTTGSSFLDDLPGILAQELFVTAVGLLLCTTLEGSMGVGTSSSWGKLVSGSLSVAGQLGPGTADDCGSVFAVAAGVVAEDISCCRC